MAYIGLAGVLGAALIALIGTLIPVLFLQGGNGGAPASQPATTGAIAAPSAAPSGGSAPVSSPGSPVPAAGSPSPVGVPTASGNSFLLYKDKPFALLGGGCTDANSYNNFPNVVFRPDRPVDTQVTPSQPGAAFELVLYCSKRTIEYQYHAALVPGHPDFNSCYAALNQDYINNGISLSRLNLKTSLCLINIQGTELAVITLRSLADSATDTHWTATVYQILENN